jgi:regulator of RNase E activity RraB
MALPDELYHQIDMDDSTLGGLARPGDDPESTHAVEHHFFAPTSAPLRELSALGIKLGFQPSSIEHADDEKGAEYFYCDLVSQARLAPELVYRESLLMHLLGECYGADYDGWGTLVQRKTGTVEQ